MIRNYKLLSLAILLAFASCGFTSKTFTGNDKDKLLIQLITYVLESNHFEPKSINDEFSIQVYNDFLEQIDPYKRFFYASDIKEFEIYKYDIDDQLLTSDLSFFNLTFERLIQRIEESKDLYKKTLSVPFNFYSDETYNVDIEKWQYAKSKKEMRERWRQILKFSSLKNYYDEIEKQEHEEFSSEKKSLSELEETARNSTLDTYKLDYESLDELDREDLFTSYINTVVDQFDPHTTYLAPRDKDDFDTSISGSFEGIGARLQKKGSEIKVIALISGGPAWRQKELEVGDLILKVRQEDEEEAVSIIGTRISDAIKLIKGPKGTNVILTLKRVDGTIEDITITRDIVELEETFAKSALVEKNDNTFGVINLPSFYIDFNSKNSRTAASDVKIELERLKKGGMEGLVLDLRNNGGGSLETVIDIVGYFIKKGPVVQVINSGKSKKILKDTDASVIWDGPLVVLVNELSASASEILAAAMQDYKRAIVIGSKQTYGKGTVQNLIDLNRLVKNNSQGDMGYLKLTTQKFYRINGGSTQLKGVKSDVVVPDRYSYIDFGERDQETPLAWDKIDPVSFDKWENNTDYKLAKQKSIKRMKNNKYLEYIDENAKWIKTIRDNNNYSLNYTKYKADLDLKNKKAKHFEEISKYNSNLTFKSLPYELRLFKNDTILKEKRERWHKELSKDVYLDEAFNVLNDLNENREAKLKVATTLKD